MRGTAAQCRCHHRDLLSLSSLWSPVHGVQIRAFPPNICQIPGQGPQMPPVELGSRRSATSPAMGHYALMEASRAKKQKEGETPDSALRVPSCPHGRGGDPAQSDRRRPRRSKVRLDPPEGPGNPRQTRECSGSVTPGGPAKLVTELESFLQLGARAERQ